MKSSAKKVELASVDDLFSTEESRADAGREKVIEIPLSELHSFKGHPFKVKDDDAMMETADSIRQYGVLVPAIVESSCSSPLAGRYSAWTGIMIRLAAASALTASIPREGWQSMRIWEYCPFTVSRYCRRIVSRLIAFTSDTSMPDS